MATTIRFRTQDTRAAWARKLNQLFSPPASKFKSPVMTWSQWERKLDAVVAYALTQGYSFSSTLPPEFRLGDTRQMWCRKLNVMAQGITGAAKTLAISVVAGDDAVTTAEAASVTLSGTSANLPDGSVVSLSVTSSTGVVTSYGTTTVASNAWTKAANNLSALANGAYTVTATSPGAKTATRPITRTA